MTCNDKKTLTQLMTQYDLVDYEDIVSWFIAAFEGFPFEDETDAPAYQLARYLSRSTSLESAERKVRFKHELSKLKAFESRAYTLFRDGKLRFFNPLCDRYIDFKKQNINVETYFTVTRFPPADMILKQVELSTTLNASSR